MALTEELSRCLEQVEELSPEQKTKWVDLVLALTLRSRPSLFREAGLLAAPEPPPAPAPAEPAPEPQPATKPQPESAQKAPAEPPPDRPVRDFDLDPHVIELLEGAGLDTWQKVADYRAKQGDLTAIKGIGKATDAEIVKALTLE